MALAYFITHQWKFLNDKGLALNHQILPCDYDSFGYNFDGVELGEYFKRAVYGGRLFLFKESPETLPAARKSMKR